MTVFVDAILQTEFSDYEIPAGFEQGGSVVFFNPPAANAVIRLERKTDITQQVDYTLAAFPSQTHENQLDKIVMILQELLYGRIEGDLTFDLSTTQGISTVTIVNSGGTDATIPAWVNATLAGVFHGEVGTAPADESATSKPDGYIWIEV